MKKVILETELIELDKSISKVKWGVAILMTFVLGTYFVWFSFCVKAVLSDDGSKWGAFGDFFGGILNPAVAFLALFWLTKSVRLQKQELHETKLALQDSANAQQDQAKLAALTALTSSIMTEVLTKRDLLSYYSDQLSNQVNGALYNVDGEIIKIGDARKLMSNVNRSIEESLINKNKYEKQIIEIMNKSKAV